MQNWQVVHGTTPNKESHHLVNFIQHFVFHKILVSKSMKKNFQKHNPLTATKEHFR